jgi:hypothetical protein
VLNDAPPNKAEELAKCQRYFQKFDSVAYPSIGFGYWEGNGFFPLWHLPVPMRACPAVAYSGNWRIWNGTVGYEIKSIIVQSVGTPAINPSIICLKVDPVSTSGLVVGNVYALCGRADSASYIYLSADL